AEFRMLAVRERARGRGAGRALVEACLDRARAADLRGLRLVTQANMPAAQRMYERMGFRRTPERDWTLDNGVRLLAYHMPL
ncbi:MAG: GNAT family N-acetyltransferase, partial [Actinomadura rubrobrunea]|nr:GNAT family N-acetyltransferase [Actinomadura rubrobrunea]